MAILGAHQSIAGGYDKAVERARQRGCDCVQLFLKSNNQWAAKDITAQQARRFREALKTLNVGHPMAHDSYLINLASPDRLLWRRSVDAFIAELHRAELLGVGYVVTHPGSYTLASEEVGLGNVVRAVDEIHAQTRKLRAQCLLETTAGQGTALGWKFEQIAAIFDRVKDPDRLGVCFDTCHVFAAGYEFSTPKQYNATITAFNRLVGLKQIKAFHLNDSRRECGSRVDRHEHIGRGRIGLRGFRLLLADERFRHVPMYLETPKGEDGGVDWDVRNLQVLRGLL